MSSSARTFASLVSCCALAAFLGLSQTACAPKQSVSVPEEVSASSGSEELDIALAISRELYLAASSPNTLVGSDSLTVSEQEEHRATYGNNLELTSDPLSSLQLPTGLLQLENTGGSGEWNMEPVPGSAEALALAELHTKEALCSAGETVCITSPYGVRRSSSRSHKGIDIRAPLGSPIMAFRGGTVQCAQYHRSYGYMVEIQQDDGIVARYAHMSQILVRKGDRVEPGLMIGRVGSTGRSTGPHLHFELLRDNSPMNPMMYLPTPKQVVTKGTEADAAAARQALAKSGHSSKKKTVKKTTSSKKSSVSSSKKTSSKSTAARKTTSTKKSSATTAKKTSTKK